VLEDFELPPKKWRREEENEETGKKQCYECAVPTGRD
jgi:hypothetical protein